MVQQNTPIDELYLFTGLPNIFMYFGTNHCMCRKPTQPFTIYKINSLKYKNKICHKLNTRLNSKHMKTSPFWVHFKTSIKYVFVKTTNFYRCSGYHMFYRLQQQCVLITTYIHCTNTTKLFVNNIYTIYRFFQNK